MAVSLSPLEQIRAAEARAVGASQTVKAVRKGWALLVLVARGADRKGAEPAVRAAQEAGVPLAEVAAFSLVENTALNYHFDPAFTPRGLLDDAGLEGPPGL